MLNLKYLLRSDTESLNIFSHYRKHTEKLLLSPVCGFSWWKGDTGDLGQALYI